MRIGELRNLLAQIPPEYDDQEVQEWNPGHLRFRPMGGKEDGKMWRVSYVDADGVQWLKPFTPLTSYVAGGADDD